MRVCLEHTTTYTAETSAQALGPVLDTLCALLNKRCSHQATEAYWLAVAPYDEYALHRAAAAGAEWREAEAAIITILRSTKLVLLTT